MSLPANIRLPVSRFALVAVLSFLGGFLAGLAFVDYLLKMGGHKA